MPSAENRVASASREVRAAPDRIFELIADPSKQPEWDGNDNLAEAARGQRVRAVGDVFSMTLTMGSVRENHVVEFAEGRLMAWKPAEPGQPPIGHLWRWEVEPIDDERSLVVHTYDWTDLHDESRYQRARATTSECLAASIDRLAALVENGSTMNTTVTDEQIQQLAGTAKPYSLVLLWWGPERYMDGAEATELEHQRRMVSLRADGVIAILCPAASEALAGAAIMNVPPEEAREIMDGDPCVQARMILCDVHQCHSFPGDALPA